MRHFWLVSFARAWSRTFLVAWAASGCLVTPAAADSFLVSGTGSYTAYVVELSLSAPGFSFNGAIDAWVTPSEVCSFGCSTPAGYAAANGSDLYGKFVFGDVVYPAWTHGWPSNRAAVVFGSSDPFPIDSAITHVVRLGTASVHGEFWIVRDTGDLERITFSGTGTSQMFFSRRSFPDRPDLWRLDTLGLTFAPATIPEPGTLLLMGPMISAGAWWGLRRLL